MQKNFASDEKKIAALTAEIERLCEGLVYISETDSPLSLFRADAIGDLSVERVAEAAGVADRTHTEIRSASEFFERLSTEKDWFGDTEKEKAKRFGELWELLDKHLRDLKVYRFGNVRIDIVVAGIDGEGNAAGVRTFAVET